MPTLAQVIKLDQRGTLATHLSRVCSSALLRFRVYTDGNCGQKNIQVQDETKKNKWIRYGRCSAHFYKNIVNTGPVDQLVCMVTYSLFNPPTKTHAHSLYLFHGDEVWGVMEEMNVDQVKLGAIETPPGPHEALTRPLALWMGTRRYSYLLICSTWIIKSPASDEWNRVLWIHKNQNHWHQQLNLCMIFNYCSYS